MGYGVLSSCMDLTDRWADMQPPPPLQKTKKQARRSRGQLPPALPLAPRLENNNFVIGWNPI